MLAIGASLKCKLLATDSGAGAAFSRPNTFRTCTQLSTRLSSTNSTAISTASKPWLRTQLSTCAMVLLPSSRRIKPCRKRCKGSGMSANGVPILKAPGLRCTSAM